MINLSQALDAVMHSDELNTELANLKRENAELRQRLTAETMRANEQSARADFYFAMATEKVKRHE